jgi:hypothetical protein
LATGENQLDIEMQYLLKQKELYEANGLDMVDLEQEIALKKIDVAKFEKDEKEKLEIRERAMKEQTSKDVTNLISGGLDFLIDALGRDEEARKRNANAIKAFETAKVLTNLYSEISAIWKYASSAPINALIPGAGNVMGAIQTGLAVGRSVLAISNIKSQKFARGGRVKGSNIPTQSNGDNVLATVRSGEVVLTEAHQRSLGGANTFRNIGVPGFATGGVVGQMANNVSLSPSSDVGQTLGNSNVFVDEIREMRKDMKSWNTTLKADVVYDEFESKKATIDGARSGASW